MQVHALEQYLGVSLFRRQGRLIELSEHGVQFLPKIRDGLDALQTAIDNTRAVQGHGPLRISMLGSFLTQWLMPRLPQFETLHPGFDLRIENSTSLVDFQRSEVQAAIMRRNSGRMRLARGASWQFTADERSSLAVRHPAGCCLSGFAKPTGY
jgi:LysR family glycine cleavage system transcriptional activator